MFPNINTTLNQAIQDFQRGNFEEAKKKLKYILNVQPKNLPALEVLGIVYANSKDLPQALKYFEKIIKMA